MLSIRTLYSVCGIPESVYDSDDEKKKTQEERGTAAGYLFLPTHAYPTTPYATQERAKGTEQMPNPNSQNPKADTVR